MDEKINAVDELRKLADRFEELAEQGVQLNNHGAAQLARARANTISRK